MSQTPDELVNKANELYTDFENYLIFREQQFAILDPSHTQIYIDKFAALEKEITDPSGVYLSELKRKLVCDRQNLEITSSGKLPELDDIISTFNIPESDVAGLKNWLVEHRQEVIKANDNVLNKWSNTRKIPIVTGSHYQTTKAQEMVMEALSQLTTVASDMLENREWLGNYQFLTDTFATRSKANPYTKQAVIAIPRVVFYFNDKLAILTEELLEHFGHEILGHCQLFYCTETAKIPIFLKLGLLETTIASQESVTQYFEKRFIEYLKDNPSKLVGLTFISEFEEVYDRYNDKNILGEYFKIMDLYGIYLMGKYNQDNQAEIHRHISEVSISPTYANNFLSRHRNDWHPVTKKALPKVLAELRYAANPIKRVFTHQTAAKHRKLVEKTMVQGYWTPQGLEEWILNALPQE